MFNTFRVLTLSSCTLVIATGIALAQQLTVAPPLCTPRN